jgi:Zn-finger nucleic acid-binding protein
MQCPACTQELTVIEAAPGLMVDFCQNGCHGIWFDAFELKQLDEQHEHPDSPLLQPPAPAAKKTTHRLVCPRCESVKLFQHHFSVARQIMVDSCPQCGGHWLDAGELQQIRQQYRTAEDREEAALIEIEEHLEPHRRKPERTEPEKKTRTPLLLPLVEWIVMFVDDL